MHVASGRGDLTLMTWLLDHFPYQELKSEVVEAAVRKGHLHVLEFLLDLSCGPRHKKQEIIFGNDSRETKKVAASRAISVPWIGQCMDFAVRSSQYKVVRWLREHDLCICREYHETTSKIVSRALEIGGEDFTNFMMRLGVHGDDVLPPERVKVIMEYSIDIECAVCAFETVAKFGNLELMQQLVQLHSPLPKHHPWLRFWKRALTDACCQGDVRIVKWLVEHWIGLELRYKLLRDVDCRQLVSIAVSWDNIDVMEYLHRQKFMKDTWSDDGIMIAAMRHDNMNCVKWLIEHGWRTQRPEGMIQVAARSGRLDLLKYFHSMDTLEVCDNSRGEIKKSIRPMKLVWAKGLAMATAALYGHMDVVQWLHVNDVAGNTSKLMGNAAVSGHLELLQWIHANRPNDVKIGQALDHAASNGHIEVVKWLVSVTPAGSCMNDTMDHVAAKGELDTLKWLHENTDARCTVKAMDSAAANGHLDLVKWLHENTDCGCTVDMAADRGHLDVVKWLHANRSEGCSAYAIERAARNADMRMITWLHAHFPQHIPVRLDPSIYMYDRREFEMLIFLHVHFRKLYTLAFVDNGENS